MSQTRYHDGSKRGCPQETEAAASEIQIEENYEAKSREQCFTSVDSGVDLRSLTKLIDDRVEEKLRSCCETRTNTTSEEEIIKTVYNANRGFMNQARYNAEERELNIIIHGINEGTFNDTEYLSKLFSILGLDFTGLCASHRLGMKHTVKSRPLKIIMKSVIEKNEVMSRLGRLKDAVAEFKKISITDDYTREKREEIKIWIMLAKEKNIKEETGHTWKVRGTPKEGLRLALIKHQ